ncbi:unnamed protein product [Closterium sp. NIES-65]|nr:unnamed protein product [Closterium sp. NIES-65]
MIACNILRAPACTRCNRCIDTYYLVMKLTSLVASFAYRPSSALLRCLLSLLLTCSARFRSLLENLGVAPLPAVVPDSLVVALLEGVMEEHNLLLIFFGTQVIAQEERDNVAIAAARKEALISMVIAAGDPGASGAIGGTGNVEGWRGKAVASYLEPWPGGGGGSSACVREMLLGETSYCPQA